MIKKSLYWLVSLLLLTYLSKVIFNHQTALANLLFSNNSSSEIKSGENVVINGQNLPLAWQGNQSQIAIADTGLKQWLGMSLLSNNSPQQQPLQWYDQKLVVEAWFDRHYRYLDLTNLAHQLGWQFSINGNVLNIVTPTATIQNMQLVGSTNNALGNPEKLILAIDQPAPWRIKYLGRVKTNQPFDEDDHSQRLFQWSLTIDAKLAPHLKTNTAMKISQLNQQTICQFILPGGWQPAIDTTANSLIINFRPDYLKAQDIVWQNGLWWRQRYLKISPNQPAFPVTWLELDLQQKNLTMLPIVSQKSSVIGLSPLGEIAKRSQAIAAINGGFFNKIKQLPLGAIRHNQNWLSGPILNRGAIAWNQLNQITISPLTLVENLTILSDNTVIPIDYLNSGYIQPGMSRYTTAWGPAYMPLTNEEIILIVEDDQIIDKYVATTAGQMSFPIPLAGYLLILRKADHYADLLTIGAKVRLESDIIPKHLSNYSQILGAGPLLIKNGQIVLNAAAEKFNDKFINQTASRSAIALTNDQKLLMITVHNRINGNGPTLAELAELLLNLGAIEALNLDGGSSTGLYLGGQIVDRPAEAVSPVHNGLGITQFR